MSAGKKLHLALGVKCFEKNTADVSGKTKVDMVRLEVEAKR